MTPPSPPTVAAHGLTAPAPRARVSSRNSSRKLSADLLLTGWLLVAVVFTLAAYLPAIGRPFDHPHAWVSAHFATIARSFLNHGIVELGGVPIQNNPPLGAMPDVYLHWPPLFGYVLAGAFGLFGESEAVATLLMLVILLGTCVTLGTLVARCGGSRAGIVAALSFLAMPVTVLYGRMVAHLHLAIFAMLVALLGFLEATRAETRLARPWAIAGATALVVAVWASWEPVLVCPGLLVVALWRRRRVEVRLALWYSAAAALGVASVITLYTLSAPVAVAELWHTLLYRTGLAPYAAPHFDPHTLFQLDDYARRPPRAAALWLLAARMELVGQLPVLALGLTLARIVWTGRRRQRPERSVLLLGGLLAPWGLWCVGMFNHVALHEYEVALAAPVLAAAVGLVVARMLETSRGTARTSDPEAGRAAETALALLLPAVLLLSMIPAARQSGSQESARTLIAYARAVAAGTPPGSVVLTPSNSMLPVYYSQRHVIRGVAGDALVERVEAELKALFPDVPAFLALPPAEHSAFERALARYPVVRSSPDLTLLAIPEHG